jgi:hypothetical protein
VVEMRSRELAYTTLFFAVFGFFTYYSYQARYRS